MDALLQAVAHAAPWVLLFTFVLGFTTGFGYAWRLRNMIERRAKEKAQGGVGPTP